MENITNFNFYLKFTKPLIFNLSEINDKALASAWVKRLAADSSTDEQIKVEYLKLLLFILQQKKLSPPFTQHPNNIEKLEPLPQEKTILDLARRIQAESGKKQPLKDCGDHSPYICDFSADLLEYVAIQDIPNFGVHGYFAVSKSPINTWDRVDKKVFPKAAKSLKEVAFTPPCWTETLSAPDISPPKPEEKIDSPMKETPTTADETSPVSTPEQPSRKKKDLLKPTVSSPSRPIGTKKVKEDEERKPPSWGSNLLEIKDALQTKIEANLNFSSSEAGKHKSDFSQSPFGREALSLGDVLIDQEINLADLSFGSPIDKKLISPSSTPVDLKSEEEYVPTSPPKKIQPASKKKTIGKAKMPLKKKVLSSKKEQIEEPIPTYEEVEKEFEDYDPFAELEKELEDFGKVLEDIEDQYQTIAPVEEEIEDLEEKDREETFGSDLEFQAETSPTQNALKDRKHNLSIPKHHGASLPVEKNIHLSPEAQLILNEAANLEMQQVKDKQLKALEDKQKVETPQKKQLPQQYLEEYDEAQSPSAAKDNVLKTTSLAGKDKHIASVFDRMGELTEKIVSPKKVDTSSPQSKRAVQLESPLPQKNLAILGTEAVDENVNLDELITGNITSPVSQQKHSIRPQHLTTQQQQLEDSMEDFEMLERKIADELKQQGLDPQAKTKKFQMSQKQLREGRKQYISMRNKIDDQLQELEGADPDRLLNKSVKSPTSPKKQQLEDSMEDFEMLERKMADELKQQGIDPQDRSKQFQMSQKQLRKGRQQYISMRNKADSQLQELEGVDPEEQQMILEELKTLNQQMKGGKPGKPDTPPMFSKHKRIRDLAKNLQYPSEDGEKWVSGTEFFKDMKTQDQETFEPEIKRKEPKYLAGVDLEQKDDLDDIDFFDDVELFEFSPKVPQKLLKDYNDLEEFLNDQEKCIPAMAGVPITVPRMSPSPHRWGFDQFGLPRVIPDELQTDTQTKKLEDIKRTKYIPPESPPPIVEEDFRHPTEEEYFRQFSPDHFKYKYTSPETKFGELKPLRKVPELHEKFISSSEEQKQLEHSGLKSPKKYNLKRKVTKRKIEFEDQYSPDENEIIIEQLDAQIEEEPWMEILSGAVPTDLVDERTPAAYLAAFPDVSSETSVDAAEDLDYLEDEEIPDVDNLPALTPTEEMYEKEEFEKFASDLQKHEIDRVGVKGAHFDRRKVPLVKGFKKMPLFYTSTIVEEQPKKKKPLGRKELERMEKEAEAEIAKQRREFIGAGLLDESLPGGLESPLRPQTHVPFYETPPELKRKPVVKTPKKIDYLPSSMGNIARETPPDYYFNMIEEKDFPTPTERRLLKQAEAAHVDDVFEEGIPQDFAPPLSPMQAKDIEAIARRQYEQLLSPPSPPIAKPRDIKATGLYSESSAAAKAREIEAIARRQYEQLLSPGSSAEQRLPPTPPNVVQSKRVNTIDFKYHETKIGGQAKRLPPARELMAVDIDREVLLDLGITEEQLQQMNLSDSKAAEAEELLLPETVVDPETAQCVSDFLEDIQNVASDPRIQLFIESYQRAKPGWKISRLGQTLISKMKSPDIENLAMQIIKFVNDPDLEVIMQDISLVEKLSLHPRIVLVTNSIKQLSQNKEIKMLAQQALQFLNDFGEPGKKSKAKEKKTLFPKPKTGIAIIPLLLAGKLSNVPTSPFLKKSVPKEDEEDLQASAASNAFIKKFRATQSHNHFKVLFQALFTKYKSKAVDPIKGECNLLLQNPHIQATLELLQNAVANPSAETVSLFDNQLSEITNDKTICSELNNLTRMLSEITPKQVAFLNLFNFLVLLLGLKKDFDTKHPGMPSMGKTSAQSFEDKLNSTATHPLIKSVAQNLYASSKNNDLNKIKKQLHVLAEDPAFHDAIQAVGIALHTPNIPTLSMASEQIRKLKSNSKMRSISDDFRKFIETQFKGKTDVKIASELAPIVVLALHRDILRDDTLEVERQSETEAICTNLYYKMSQLFDNPVFQNLVTKLGRPGRDLIINALVRKLRYLSQDPMIELAVSKIRESRENDDSERLYFLFRYWNNLTTDTALLEISQTIQTYLGEDIRNLDQQTIVLLPLVIIALAEGASPKRIKGHRKLVTEQLSRLPGVQETEEEHQPTVPKGWDMHWEMPAEERVKYRAPGIHVPPPVASRKYQQIELEEPPHPEYIPLKKLPFDRRLPENQLIAQVPPASSPVQGELRVQQTYNPENELVNQEVRIEGQQIPVKRQQRLEKLKPRSFAEILSEAEEHGENLKEESFHIASPKAFIEEEKIDIFEEEGGEFITSPRRQEHIRSPISPRRRDYSSDFDTPDNEPHYQILEVSADVHDIPKHVPSTSPRPQLTTPPRSQYHPGHEGANVHLEAVDSASPNYFDQIDLGDEIPEELKNYKWLDAIL